MNILRFILWAILVYLCYVFYKNVFKRNHRQKEVNISGTPINKSLDLSDYDVEDADFEDLDED